MAKLIKTKVEREGTTNEQMSIVEADDPPVWTSDAKLGVIGKPAVRIDGAERVTGRAVYTADVRLPGMLYARLLRSPHAHAKVKEIDVSRAMAFPGVRAIITGMDAPDIPFLNVKTLEPLLRYAGDEVAAVAADSEETAEEAIHLITVKYEVLPFVLTSADAVKTEAIRIYPQGNLVDGKPRTYNRGNIKKGFTGADVVLEHTFRTQSALHNCMEPHGAVASWNGDELTVWESTQSIYHVQDDLMQAFHLPLNKIRVICNYMGGGFGSKQYTGKWSIIAALLAKKSGRPVKLMFDRHEENIAAGNRAPTTQTLKIGAKRDGILTAIELHVLSAVGAYGERSLEIDGPAKTLYNCPNVYSEVRSVHTNTGPARSFRGPGYVEGMFPLESLMDILAAELKIDPIEIRMKNYAKIDVSGGQPFSAKHLDECYKKGADLIGWQEGRREHDTKSTVKHGFGMASQIWGGGGGPTAYAWVRLNEDGSVLVITGSQDIGTGTKTALAQIAAEELGMNVSDVRVQMGDTGIGPYDPVSWGSMTVSSVGPAVRQAAIDVRNQIRDVSAGFLNVPAETVEVKGGKIYVGGNIRPRLKISDLADELGDFTLLGKGARGPNDDNVEVKTFGAQFAHVEVDTVTGEINVLKLVTVHDCGRIVNPLSSACQVEGAVMQGIGYALTEGRVIDDATGIVLNANLEEYLLPTASDFGEIRHAFIDKPDEKANTLGVKGLGEPALIPTAPAIANAVAHATGIRFLSLPISREKVIEGLQKKNRFVE